MGARRCITASAAGLLGLRRLSSATSVELEADCCFERIQAPSISFGDDATVEPERESHALVDASFERLEGAVRQSDHVTLIRGNCKLPRMHRYHGSLVVTGRLLIGAGTEILGDVKARDGIVMGAGARVQGALCSEKQIQILDHAHVTGPLVSSQASCWERAFRWVRRRRSPRSAPRPSWPKPVPVPMGPSGHAAWGLCGQPEPLPPRRLFIDPEPEGSLCHIHPPSPTVGKTVRLPLPPHATFWRGLKRRTHTN